MKRKNPGTLDEKEWNLLSELMNDHQYLAGLYEGAQTRFQPQTSPDILYARRLFLKGNLKLLNEPAELHPQNWSPIYALSQKTKRQFNLS